MIDGTLDEREAGTRGDGFGAGSALSGVGKSETEIGSWRGASAGRNG